jgi:polyglycine hydrolase-like protein
MNARGVFALIVFASVLLAGIPGAAAQTCRWDGTGPFCDGSCGANETEVSRLDKIPGHWVPPFVNVNPPFGADCLTGTKALCCNVGRGSTCRWDGTAPFCDGSCRQGETAGQPPAGSSSGSSCWTGSKAYCCHSNVSVLPTGVVRSPLTASPKFSRYAALWDKGSGPAWQARHGLTSAQYQQEFNRLLQQGYRLVEVSGHSVDNKDSFAAIWEQRQGPAWQARHGLTSAQYQQEFDRLGRQGYRLVHINGYAVAGQERYAAIWEQGQGPAWQARHGLTSAQYQQEFDRLVGQGYRLVDVSGYTIGNQDRYAAIWEQRQGPAWVARHGMTSAQYQQQFNTHVQQHYRLVRVSGWRSGIDTHYAAIWEQVDGPAWVARHGLLSDSYQEEFDRLVREGYRLRHVSGYHTYN